MRIIAIDFDGTIVEDKYPGIGNLKPGAKEVINKLYSEGYEIIIWSCRQRMEKAQAIEFLVKSGVKYHRFNESSPRNLRQYKYKDTRKIYANLYIDDRGLMQPLPSWEEIYELVHQFVYDEADMIDYAIGY